MDPAAFNETLTRIDSLYFTLTVFATVGFGDIAAGHPAGASRRDGDDRRHLVMLAVCVSY